MKRKIWSILFKLFVLCFVFYITYVLTVQQPVLQVKNKEIEELDRKIKEAEIKNLDLKEQLILVDSDTYIEKEARDKLGLIKPGEKVFIDIDN